MTTDNTTNAASKGKPSTTKRGKEATPEKAPNTRAATKASNNLALLQSTEMEIASAGASHSKKKKKWQENQEEQRKLFKQTKKEEAQKKKEEERARRKKLREEKKKTMEENKKKKQEEEERKMKEEEEKKEEDDKAKAKEEEETTTVTNEEAKEKKEGAKKAKKGETRKMTSTKQKKAKKATAKTSKDNNEENKEEDEAKATKADEMMKVKTVEVATKVYDNVEAAEGEAGCPSPHQANKDAVARIQQSFTAIGNTEHDENYAASADLVPIVHDGQIWTQIPNAYESEALAHIRYQLAVYFHNLCRVFECEAPSEHKDFYNLWSAFARCFHSDAIIIDTEGSIWIWDDDKNLPILPGDDAEDTLDVFDYVADEPIYGVTDVGRCGGGGARVIVY